MTLQAIAPTFGGNASHVEIGGARYGLPPAAQTRRIHGDHKRQEALYVLEDDGTLHLLIEAGEVSIPARLVDALRAGYFPESSSRPS